MNALYIHGIFKFYSNKRAFDRKIDNMLNKIIINIITNAKDCVNHVIYDVFNILVGSSPDGERIGDML